MMYAFLPLAADDRFDAHGDDRLAIRIRQPQLIMPVLELVLPNDDEEAIMVLLKLAAAVDAGFGLVRERHLIHGRDGNPLVDPPYPGDEGAGSDQGMEVGRG